MIRLDLIPHHTTVKLVLKAALALFCAFLLMSMLLACVELIAEGDSVSTADLINWCESDYAERDLASLSDTLKLYDLYSQDFALYREAVEAYEAAAVIRTCAAVSDPSAEIQSLKEEARSTLASLCESPQFERNRALIREIAAGLPE